ncbi:AMP-binding protein [Acidiferrimicrobium sp. IK]|uniref:AMP-binding protein n=1 Tax=Acidiferrimicrobium sp. IK TaxID=2871700 RepID=UPI0021CB6386|nr:AMP-binding protein [Acidiferrimicrobium sp. IK]MCU4183443.1 AMP-binding protein [Acidiferrimicrobium sp. IK]
MRHAPYKEARQALAARWRSEGWQAEQTVAAALDAGAERHPTARLVFGSRTRPATLTTRDVQEQGRRLAAVLARRGLRPGDTLVMQLPNWAEWAVGWYASMYAGLVVAPVVHIYGAAELGYIVRDCGARALITPDTWRSYDYLERIAAMGPCPALDLVVAVGERAVPGGVVWDDLVHEEAAPSGPAPRRPDDPCLLLYTSGTTADPKGVVHTSNSFLAEIQTMANELTRDASTVFLNGGPAGHITGALTNTRPFLDGSTAVSMDAWNPEDAVDLSLRYGVTASVGAPVFLNTMLDVAEAKGVTLGLREFMLGAASVPPSAVARADQAGMPGYRCYGSTEHPTISTGHPGDPFEVRAFTDGSVIAGTEVRIVDENGRVLPAGRDGDILSIGPDQFSGYLTDELNADAFTPDGWFRTGDIGHLDQLGNLTITDRRKDVIIRGGENLSSKEIEDALARHPFIAEAAVVAAPDDRLGETACAFIVPRPGETVDLRSIGSWFAELGVARQKTPERLVIVDDLPRTPSGKIRKVELRARLSSPDGCSSESVSGTGR